MCYHEKMDVVIPGNQNKVVITRKWHDNEKINMWLGFHTFMKQWSYNFLYNHMTWVLHVRHCRRMHRTTNEKNKLDKKTSYNNKNNRLHLFVQEYM